MILLNHTVDVTGIFMANNIHIERQRYTLFIYGKRPGTKKRLNQQCKKNNQKKVINMRFISREFIFHNKISDLSCLLNIWKDTYGWNFLINVINSNKIEII